MCCDSWGRKESDTTERLNRTELMSLCAGALIASVLSDCVTVARQASLSMGFSRPEYWSGLPCASTALAGKFFTTSTTWKALIGAQIARS